MKPDLHTNSKFFKSCITYYFNRRELGDTFGWQDPTSKRRMSAINDAYEFNLQRGRIHSHTQVTNLKGRDEPPKGWGKP